MKPMGDGPPGGSVAVVGVGNIIMTDEGIGIYAVRALRDGAGPCGACYLEGGTALWRVLPQVKDRERLVLLDALSVGEEPGTVCCADIHSARLEDEGSSLHNVSLRSALAREEMQGNSFERVTVVGMEPAEVTAGIGLSQVCARHLNELLAAAGRVIPGCSAATGDIGETANHAGYRAKAGR
jgi:hydrogenase maturation protease